MPSCTHEIYMLCLKGFLVIYLGVGAFCCLKVVVASSWLCHFGPRLAIGLPRVSWLLPKPYWARLTLLGQLEGCRGIF